MKKISYAIIGILVILVSLVIIAVVLLQQGRRAGVNGVISGAASATIALQIISNFTSTWPEFVSLGMSALAAGLTVGGKAVGKSFAVNSCTSIVHAVGKFLHWLRHFSGKQSKKKTN